MMMKMMNFLMTFHRRSWSCSRNRSCRSTLQSWLTRFPGPRRLAYTRSGWSSLPRCPNLTIPSIFSWRGLLALRKHDGRNWLCQSLWRPSRPHQTTLPICRVFHFWTVKPFVIICVFVARAGWRCAVGLVVLVFAVVAVRAFPFLGESSNVTPFCSRVW